jgi:large subunit ribosomal protein L15
MTKLSNLKPAPGSTKNRKRRGIGSSSGHGGTSTKGHKGQNARTGGGVPTWYEGGQMPLIRRIPKRGFVNIHRVANQVVNIKDLARFQKGATVDLDALVKAGLVRANGGPIKLLATGDIDRAITLKVDVVSEAAQKKIEAAGGTVESVKGVTVPHKVTKQRKAAIKAARAEKAAARKEAGKAKGKAAAGDEGAGE